MITYRVEIEGLDEMLEAIKRAPEVSARELNKAISRLVMVDIRNAIVKETPVNKGGGGGKKGYGGNLRQSISGRMTSHFSGEISTNSPYGAFVHEGTRPHIIRPVSQARGGVHAARALWWVGAAHPVRMVNHPGTRANPYMARGVEKSAPMIKKRFDAAIDAILKSLEK